ncbi:MAG: preprotein translocase subunit SecY [bacterium]
MAKMLKGFQNILRVPELRRRILFTLAMIAVYRLGSQIPTPGINVAAISNLFQQASSARGLLGLLDLFSGGSLSRLSIFALGIMPYISASIIIQLLAVVIPYLENLQKEGEAGRRKITQYTRYGTIVLAAIQSFGMLNFINVSVANAIPSWGFNFLLTAVLTLTAGTAFLMWLGEQITERGIGNGISLIIFVGIVARTPHDIASTIRAVRTPGPGSPTPFGVAIFAIIAVAVIAGIIVVQQAQRRIPVQYPKRIRGRRVYQGTSTHLPLRVNTAGVIPIIFATSIGTFPSLMASFIKHPVMEKVSQLLAPGAQPVNSLFGLLPQNLQSITAFRILQIFTLYEFIAVVLIIFFTYFYTAVVFNPNDVADNMRKYGGFIPGIRPGKPTATFIDQALSRITLAGAIFLAVVYILPSALNSILNIPFYFGGTSLLIIVGVALDTMQQIESHLLMRYYEGFMSKGKLRGRR